MSPHPKKTRSKMDVFSKEKRSEVMSRIRAKDTEIELMLRRQLWNWGLRYRIHYNLEGKPDIVFSSRKIAVFIDGCFWHKCPICYRTPKSNQRYWNPKIKKNVLRDKANTSSLKKKGWRVLRFWEHEIEENPEKCALKIYKAVKEKDVD